MASTKIASQKLSLGNVEGVHIRLDITSYPTNGESITPTILGLEGAGKPRLLGNPIPLETLDLGFLYDRTNQKLKAVVLSTGLEVANGTDLGEIEFTAISSVQ